MHPRAQPFRKFLTNMKKHLSLLMLVATVGLFTGCASGPSYHNVAKSGTLTPHKGNGMVLIYKTPPAMGVVGCADPGTVVYVNNVLLPGRLLKGSFYSYEAAPGPLYLSCSQEAGESTAGTKVGAVLTGGLVGLGADIASHSKSGITVNVLPDQTYYVNHNWGHLKEVTQRKAEGGIKDCHWLNPTSSQ